MPGLPDRLQKFYPHLVKIVPGVLLALGIGATEIGGGWQSLEDVSYRFLFKARGERTWDDRIVVVEIDDDSLKQLGAFPWSRKRYQSLIERLTPANPSAIAFDILLSEPSLEDPGLARAIDRQQRVLMPLAWSREGLPIFPSPMLQTALIGMGHIMTPTSSDGITRSLKPIEHGEYAFGIAIAQTYGMTQGDVKMPPLDRPLWLNWQGSTHNVKRASFADVLANKVPTSVFTDKIVLIGMTTTGADLLQTPFDRNISSSGVYFHVTVLNNLLQRNFLQVPDRRWVWELVPLGALLSWGLRQWRWRVQCAVVCGALVLWISGAIVAIHLNWWIPIVAPCLLLVGLGAITVVSDRLRMQALLQVRSEFLAVMSHELRTPLNGILGMTDLLLTRDTLAVQDRDYIQTIDRSGEMLLGLINDVLDFAKIDAGKLSLEMIPFSLQEEVTMTIALLETKAQEKAIALRHSIPQNLPPFLLGDGLRLRQVLLNLLSNAVKFTDRGSVRLEINGTAGTDQTYATTFRVIDSGIGMSKAQVDRLFQPFVQADSSIQRRYGGTGLGLVISQQLVAQMGGKLSIQSELGTGSVFKFTIDFPIAQHQDLPIIRESIHPINSVRNQTRIKSNAQSNNLVTSRSPLKILLAEDNPVNQKVALHFLAQLGYQADVVSDGEAALTQIELYAYDLILMDVQMPKLDGLSVTQKIRSSNRLDRTISIIAMTANTTDQDIRDCLAAGMDDFLGKPLRIADLDRTLKLIQSQAIRSIQASSINQSLPTPIVATEEEPNPIEPTLKQDWDAAWKALMQVTLDNRPLAIELLHLAVQENQPRILKLQTAHTQQDYAQLRAIAHQIRGSHSNLGLSVLASLSADLEHFAAKGDDAEIQRILTEMFSSMHELEIFVAEKFPEGMMMT